MLFKNTHTIQRSRIINIQFGAINIKAHLDNIIRYEISHDIHKSIPGTELRHSSILLGDSGRQRSDRDVFALVELNSAAIQAARLNDDDERNGKQDGEKSGQEEEDERSACDCARFGHTVASDSKDKRRRNERYDDEFDAAEKHFAWEVYQTQSETILGIRLRAK